MSNSKHNKLQDDAVVQAESPIETSHQETGEVNKTSESRRKFTKAGLLAPPVLMSLASRPVLGVGGVPCISNMLSGNLSHPGASCELGVSPAAWKDLPWPSNAPLYTLDPDVLILKGNIQPGQTELTCDSCSPGQSGNWKCDGTTFDDIFHDGDTRPMYQILCEDPDLDNPSEKSAFVAGILNAYASSAYVIKPMQLQDLLNNVYVHVDNKTEFLKSTWNGRDWTTDPWKP